MAQRERHAKVQAEPPKPIAPRELEALTTDDDDWVILSFQVISEGEAQVASLLRKLDVSSRLQLVTTAPLLEHRGRRAARGGRK